MASAAARRLAEVLTVIDQAEHQRGPRPLIALSVRLEAWLGPELEQAAPVPGLGSNQHGWLLGGPDDRAGDAAEVEQLWLLPDGILVRLSADSPAPEKWHIADDLMPRSRLADLLRGLFLGRFIAGLRLESSSGEMLKVAVLEALAVARGSSGPARAELLDALARAMGPFEDWQAVAARLRADFESALGDRDERVREVGVRGLLRMVFAGPVPPAAGGQPLQPDRMLAILFASPRADVHAVAFDALRELPAEAIEPVRSAIAARARTGLAHADPEVRRASAALEARMAGLRASGGLGAAEQAPPGRAPDADAVAPRDADSVSDRSARQGAADSGWPGAPGSPGSPAAPGIPVIPVSPGAPDSPMASGGPDSPAASGAPAVPGPPRTADAPATHAAAGLDLVRAMEAVAAGDPAVRAAAITALLPVVRGSDSGLRERALVSMIAAGAPEPMEAALAEMVDPQLSEAVLEALWGALDGRSSVAEAAAERIADDAGARAPNAAAAAYARILAHDAPEVRAAALRRLATDAADRAALRDRLATDLVGHLRDPEPGLRVEAARTLAAWAHPNAAGFLEQLAADADPAARDGAVALARELGGHGSAQRVLGIARDVGLLMDFASRQDGDARIAWRAALSRVIEDASFPRRPGVLLAAMCRIPADTNDEFLRFALGELDAAIAELAADPASDIPGITGACHRLLEPPDPHPVHAARLAGTRAHADPAAFELLWTMFGSADGLAGEAARRSLAGLAGTRKSDAVNEAIKARLAQTQDTAQADVLRTLLGRGRGRSR